MFTSPDVSGKEAAMRCSGGEGEIQFPGGQAPCGCFPGGDSVGNDLLTIRNELGVSFILLAWGNQMGSRALQENL